MFLSQRQPTRENKQTKMTDKYLINLPEEAVQIIVASLQQAFLDYAKLLLAEKDTFTKSVYFTECEKINKILFYLARRLPKLQTTKGE